MFSGRTRLTGLFIGSYASSGSPASTGNDVFIVKSQLALILLISLVWRGMRLSVLF
jgi:hypothetical protein